MLQLGLFTCKLRTSMAGTLITRAVFCHSSLSASLPPPYTPSPSYHTFTKIPSCQLCSRWQMRGLQSMVLRSTACIDLQLLNIKPTKVTRTPSNLCVVEIGASDGSDAIAVLETGSDDTDVEVTEISSNACVVGIDPDASGAIAVLKTGSGDMQAEVLDVPVVKVQVGKTMRRRHDARSIVNIMNQINAPEGSVAYVEQAMPFPQDGKQGWYGTGFGYGMWVGILIASGYKVVPVRAQAWKVAMGIAGKQYTKDDSRAVAISLFPDLKPLLKRKKDHGRADALLIAAFGWGLTPTTDLSLEIEVEN